MFALRLHVFTTILQGLLVILQELRNTVVGNIGRRSGSLRNVQRSMQFNQIGRLTLKPVGQENIDCGNLFSRFFFVKSIFLQFFLFWSLYIRVCVCVCVTKFQSFPSFGAFLAIIHHFGLDI